VKSVSRGRRCKKEVVFRKEEKKKTLRARRGEEKKKKAKKKKKIIASVKISGSEKLLNGLKNSCNTHPL
jgi:hypothetical protein